MLVCFETYDESGLECIFIVSKKKFVQEAMIVTDATAIFRSDIYQPRPALEAEMAICIYCRNDRELCASHAIPDAFFRSTSRRNNGKLISIPGGEGSICLSQETGKSKLLCKQCEGDFNRQFDSSLVNAFKAWDKQIKNEGFGVRYKFSANQMAQGLASIFWRACVSGNDLYANAKVCNRSKAKLLSIVQGAQDKTLKSCSCSIKRLYDKPALPTGGFSQDDISQFIFLVNAYSIGWGGMKPTSYFAFDVAMQGFLIHLFIPRLPHGKRIASGFLNPTKHQLHAPPQYIFDYPPIKGLMIAGMRKRLDGQSTLPD